MKKLPSTVHKTLPIVVDIKSGCEDDRGGGESMGDCDDCLLRRRTPADVLYNKNYKYSCKRWMNKKY